MLFSMSKTKKQYTLRFLGTLIVLVLYMKAQPSYLPKGDIQRTNVPEFSESIAIIEDRNRKPATQEETRKMREDQYKKGLQY